MLLMLLLLLLDGLGVEDLGRGFRFQPQGHGLREAATVGQRRLRCREIDASVIPKLLEATLRLQGSPY